MLLGRTSGSLGRGEAEDLITGAERLLENSGGLGDGGGEGVEASTIRRVRLSVGEEAPSRDSLGL
jgi:hypothetical protein